MTEFSRKYITAFASAAVLALGLYGCGGGGDDGMVSQMAPEDVDLSDVTAGFMAGADTLEIDAGQSVTHGDIEFSCAAGGDDCTVMVMVDANGAVTAASTGGTVTAMNSAEYQSAITPMIVDLATVTAGFMAAAGIVAVEAGQSEEHGDLAFACAAGGRDCEITVAVDANGAITATSTGGTVTAMNSAEYQNAVTPMNVDLAGVTAGFMAGAGTVTVAAGQSADHGDIAFSCAAGGRDCEITVAVDANGAVTAASTGGTVTAMNAHGHPHLHGLEASPLASTMASSAADSLESLDDASTAFAPVSAPVKITQDEMGQAGVVVLERDEEVYVESIAHDGAAGYSVVFVVDGQKKQVDFEATDWDWIPGVADYYEKTVGNSTYRFVHRPLFAGDRAPKAIHRRYFQIFGWDTGELRGYSAHGVLTPSQTLENLGSAIYEGHILAERHNNFTDPDFREVRELMWGEMTLNAEFSASTISGEIGNIAILSAAGTWSQPPDTNSIAISKGEIDGSRFHAQWTGQDTDTTSALEDSLRDFEGSMLGEFYGPGGEEVGGAFTGERAATDQVVHGRFGGESQASAAAREAIRTAAGREDGISVSQDPAVYADTPSDTLASLLPDGNTAFAPLTAIAHRDWDNYEFRQPDQGFAFVKSISSDGAQGFNVTYVIDGRDSVANFSADTWSDLWGSYNLSRRGDNNNWWFNDYWLWAYSGSFYDDPNDRTSGSSEFAYFDINGWIFNEPGDEFRGYSVYGAQTRPENLRRGIASYNGRARATIWLGDNSEPYPEDRQEVYGTLTLTADFYNSEVDGQIGDLYTQVGDYSTPREAMGAGKLDRHFQRFDHGWRVHRGMGGDGHRCQLRC